MAFHQKIANHLQVSCTRAVHLIQNASSHLPKRSPGVRQPAYGPRGRRCWQFSLRSEQVERQGSGGVDKRFFGL